MTRRPRRPRSKGVLSAADHASPAPPAAAAAAPPPRRRQRPLALLWVIALLVLASVGVAATLLYRQRPPAVVEQRNAFGEQERCATCHPAGSRPGPQGARKPHPALPGHADLASIGCTPCHGGNARARAMKDAHGPAIGSGPTAFLPEGLREIGCARCHLLDAPRVALPTLSTGRRLFASSQCIGCHRPGSHPRGLGFDLPKLPQRSPAALRALLLDPRQRTPHATMWPVTSASARGAYAKDAAGRRPALEALIAYVLMVGDQPQRQRLAAHWTPRELHIDGPCTACHALQSAAASGLPHACALLRKHEPLRCRRCHDTPPADLGALCPQIRAHLYQCGSCHLRDGDGAARLLEQALTFPADK